MNGWNEVQILWKEVRFGGRRFRSYGRRRFRSYRRRGSDLVERGLDWWKKSRSDGRSHDLIKGGLDLVKGDLSEGG